MNFDRRSKPEYVNRMFGRIARRYDLLNALMTGRQDASWRRETARLAAVDGLGPLLDVATGSGDLALALAALNPKAVVSGVDFSSAMLEVAARKADDRGLSSRVAFVRGDALALPFPDAAFEAATMGFALRNVADIPQTLREVRRVLRPSGRLANLELTPLCSGLGAALFGVYFHRLVPALGGLIAGDLVAYRYLSSSLAGFPNAEELASIMRDAGFGNVSFHLLGGGTVALHVGRK